MSRGFLISLVLLVLGSAGGYYAIHRNDNRLRFDVCQVRAAAGEVQDGGTVGSMDGVRLTVTLRGCQADPAQMCKAKITTEISPATKVTFQVKRDGMVDLNSLEPIAFRKNSEITSLEAYAEAYCFPPGEYTLTVKAEDLVAHQTVEKIIKFTSKQ